MNFESKKNKGKSITLKCLFYSVLNYWSAMLLLLSFLFSSLIQVSFFPSTLSFFFFVSQCTYIESMFVHEYSSLSTKRASDRQRYGMLLYTMCLWNIADFVNVCCVLYMWSEARIHISSQSLLTIHFIHLSVTYLTMR